MILAIKTADEIAEIYVVKNTTIVKSKKWAAGRDLSRELLSKIEQLITAWEDLSGLIVFTGPGSFTGLRIGIATMNALAYSRGIPIIGANGQNWLKKGLDSLRNGDDGKIIMPEYGKPANITSPKK